MELLLDEGMYYQLNNLASYQERHVFYVYPNPVSGDTMTYPFTPRHTRLMLTFDYNGHPCYYPVTLPGVLYGDGTATTLERNKVYHISELTLTRPGSYDTDDSSGEVSSERGFTCNVEVVDWDDYTSYEETY